MTIDSEQGIHKQLSLQCPRRLHCGAVATHGARTVSAVSNKLDEGQDVSRQAAELHSTVVVRWHLATHEQVIKLHATTTATFDPGIERSFRHIFMPCLVFTCLLVEATC
jgi:hypothetical protein